MIPRNVSAEAPKLTAVADTNAAPAALGLNERAPSSTAMARSDGAKRTKHGSKNPHSRRKSDGSLLRLEPNQVRSVAGRVATTNQKARSHRSRELVCGLGLALISSPLHDHQGAVIGGLRAGGEQPV
jgi:hypothetical protein